MDTYLYTMTMICFMCMMIEVDTSIFDPRSSFGLNFTRIMDVS